MYRITEKRSLNPTVTLMEIEAPYVAASARPGQFIILRVDEDGERIPLTVAGYDREKGTVRIIFQIVGATTAALNRKNVGDTIPDFAGPLGKPTEVEGLKKVCVVGGGVGCAIALPIAEELHRLGCEVHTVIGFRSKDLLILEKEFAAVSDRLAVMTDDGSAGRQGVVTLPLGEWNPIMIDGTGMCGGCRLTVGGETKFACVDGPDFDGYLIDFDEAMSRASMYRDFETAKREEDCNLFRGAGNV